MLTKHDNVVYQEVSQGRRWVTQKGLMLLLMYFALENSLSFDVPSYFGEYFSSKVMGEGKDQGDDNTDDNDIIEEVVGKGEVEPVTVNHQSPSHQLGAAALGDQTTRKREDQNSREEDEGQPSSSLSSLAILASCSDCHSVVASLEQSQRTGPATLPSSSIQTPPQPPLQSLMHHATQSFFPSSTAGSVTPTTATPAASPRTPLHHSCSSSLLPSSGRRLLLPRPPQTSAAQEPTLTSRKGGGGNEGIRQSCGGALREVGDTSKAGTKRKMASSSKHQQPRTNNNKKIK
eukprot:CAMPEP_0201512460 /NCGR_PEP_ID=MMETSP0161_2-20130828/4718_1 /ASSEMBLY_ACC=CAM_ASM_000251 /TAXON_ID=180227 /ORGANISM="Neoparamoeba aestuarina, Strain SoJaBio B1-5/56/2" /LENGTH=288 /DNA_ID=CAMNT_0047908323 /DNA_START=373 /DNA_END=1239 /DNA_ORIENTATION=+